MRGIGRLIAEELRNIRLITDLVGGHFTQSRGDKLLDVGQVILDRARPPFGLDAIQHMVLRGRDRKIGGADELIFV